MSKRKDEIYDLTSVTGEVSLEAYRRNALTAAAELRYGNDIRNRIRFAKSTTEIDVALKAGRDRL